MSTFVKAERMGSSVTGKQPIYMTVPVTKDTNVATHTPLGYGQTIEPAPGFAQLRSIPAVSYPF